MLKSKRPLRKLLIANIVFELLTGDAEAEQSMRYNNLADLQRLRIE